MLHGLPETEVDPQRERCHELRQSDMRTIGHRRTILNLVYLAWELLPAESVATARSR
jgi:hypothetical protein